MKNATYYLITNRSECQSKRASGWPASHPKPLRTDDNNRWCWQMAGVWSVFDQYQICQASFPPVGDAYSNWVHQVCVLPPVDKVSWESHRSDHELQMELIFSPSLHNDHHMGGVPHHFGQQCLVWRTVSFQCPSSFGTLCCTGAAPKCGGALNPCRLPLSGLSASQTPSETRPLGG